MVRLQVRVLLVLAAFLAMPSASAQEPARLALLIGNRAYTQQVGPLVNPHNDVGVVAEALKRIGFKAPTVLTDQKRSQTLAAVRKFASQLAAAGPGSVGFLYYSGHGAAEQGTNVNYLIPVDAADPNSGSFWDEAVKLDDLTRLLLDRAPQAAHFVVFDACRNELKLPDKAASKGFAVVPTLRGMFVAFASEFGRTASDVGVKSGPYAAALAAELVKPGLSHLDAFQNVKETVGLATQHKQVPWELNGLSLRVYLAGRQAEPAPQPVPAPVAPPAPARMSEAAEAWSLIKDTKDLPALDAFIRRFGDTFYGDLAKGRLDELKRAQTAVLAQTPKVEPKKPPEPAVVAPQRRCTTQEVEVDIATGPQCVKPGSGIAFRDCPDCPEMVVAPAGKFTMGSPSSEEGRYGDETQVGVRIAAPFAAGRLAITRGEFAAFVKATGHKAEGCHAWTGSEWKLQADKSWRSPGFAQDDRHPVVCVSWDDAKSYVAWLAKKTGRTYRLLSEAEREYVTRAGTNGPFWWGAQISTAQANYNGNVTYGSGQKGEYRQSTVAADSFKPNPWGLYNVHGNVWEWVEDCWNEKNDGNPGDGAARGTGECARRVVRGGSWIDVPQLLRSAFRGRDSTEDRDDYLGFRVGRTLTP